MHFTTSHFTCTIYYQTQNIRGLLQGEHPEITGLRNLADSRGPTSKGREGKGDGREGRNAVRKGEGSAGHRPMRNLNSNVTKNINIEPKINLMRTKISK